jgi:hypothetical protein
MANGQTTAKKQQLAEHALIDAQGNEVEDFEKAHGIRYTDKASGASTERTPGNTDALRMFAVFGMRTLATNQASAARQADENASGQDQIDAIDERFDLIDTGTWVDRTREGGVRYDLATLASAAVNVLIAKGKLKDEDAAKAATYTKFFEAMTQDSTKVTAVRQVDGVDAEYKRLKGRSTPSVDDLAAIGGVA